MASVINTNLASLYAQKNLSGAQNALSTSVERLSSGLRINRAKDDAAGLGISQKINSQVVALNQGVRNANDAISMVQTAEGSLSEVSSILQRMKELSVQARNDSLSTVQRSYISDELVSLKNEINSIAERTTFNDLSLLKNGLRTAVAGTAAQTGQIAEGASMFDGVTISNITLKNTNVGTYTFTGATRSLVGAYEQSSSIVAENAGQSAGSVNLNTSSGTIYSTVSEAKTAYAASARTIDLNNLEAAISTGAQTLSQEVRVVVDINGIEYAAVVGSANATSEGAVAAALTDVLKSYYYPGASASTAGLITLSSTGSGGLGLAEIKVRAEKLERGDQVADISSYVSLPGTSTSSSRTINIKDNDVVAGREFVVTIGNPSEYTSYSVIAGTGDDASDIALQLETLIDNNFTNTSQVGTTITMSSADLTGMANISIAVYDTKVKSVLLAEDGSVGQDSSRLDYQVISAKSNAASERTVTINAADLSVGNVVSVKVNGKEYAVEVGGAVTSQTDVAYALTSLMAEDFSYTASTNVQTNWVSNAGGTITITSAAELGLADISVEVSRITDEGKLKLTADANTSIGGTSQTVDVGAVANGSSKTYDFDNLGVSFTVTNNSGSELNADDFKALTAMVSQLTVESTMDGNALFQIGAGTRDNAVMTGFKDIRITGYNQNTGAEKTVFDNIASTLGTISANTTESLSVANFATLENQIEDAITTVSSFRSYLGAQQNRLEFAISNIQAQSENLTAANSRIVDTDYAAETANLTKTQIMQQAATAMLAQANQMPNVILALLK
jgi:flagellin